MSHAAGTNQTSCHSSLTFTKTAQRRRSPLTAHRSPLTEGCPCTRISLRLCLHTRFKNSTRLSLHLFLLIAMAPLSLRAFLGFFAPCFIFVSGIKHSLLCCSVIAASQRFRVQSGKCRATAALSFDVFFLFVWFSFLSGIFSPSSHSGSLLRLLTSKLMLCLPTTK